MRVSATHCLSSTADTIFVYHLKIMPNLFSRYRSAEQLVKELRDLMFICQQNPLYPKNYRNKQMIRESSHAAMRQFNISRLSGIISSRTRFLTHFKFYIQLISKFIS